MVSNMVWDSYSDEKEKIAKIRGPFLAYIGSANFKHAGDFMYSGEYPSITRSEERDDEARFGYFKPKNLIDTALRSTRMQKFYDHEDDKQVIKYLTSLKEKLKAQEAQLYSDLGCKNFREFKKLYMGRTRYKKADKKSYWLNYHLKLFTGEYQRLFASQNYSLIEKILALAAIELDEIGIIGIEDKGKGKRAIKDVLKKAQFLEFPEQKVLFKEKGKEIDVYIPTKDYRKGSDEEFIAALADFFGNEANQKTGEAIYDMLDGQLSENMTYALQQIGIKVSRLSPSKRSNKKRIDNMFVKLDFKKKDEKKSELDIVIEEVLKYLKTAREYTMTDTQRKNWNEDNRGGAMTKYLKTEIGDLIRHYYKTGGGVNFISGGKEKNIIQGFFGELSNYGKLYFNLGARENEDNDIDVFNIGNLYNSESNKLLGVDNVLVVKGKRYGIQVKNPFQLTGTKQGAYYKTYASGDNKTITLDEVDKIKNIFGFNDEEYENFAMYALNINNSTDAVGLTQRLEKFIFLYSAGFARLDEQEVKADLAEEQNSIIKSLDGEMVNNVFFVLKGELIPSSYLVNGLIKQYNFFLESWNDYHKANSAKNKVVVVSFKNELRPNRLKGSEEKAINAHGHVLGGGEEKVHTIENNRVYEDMQKVKYSHYLRLTIPGIEILDD